MWYEVVSCCWQTLQSSKLSQDVRVPGCGSGWSHLLHGAMLPPGFCCLLNTQIPVFQLPSTLGNLKTVILQNHFGQVGFKNTSLEQCTRAPETSQWEFSLISSFQFDHIELHGKEIWVYVIWEAEEYQAGGYAWENVAHSWLNLEKPSLDTHIAGK